MSTQYTARIIYGFPAEQDVGNDYLDEWLSWNHPKCSDLTAGHYDRSEHFVGVILYEVDNFCYKQPWTSVTPLLSVPDEIVDAINNAHASLITIDPSLVLGAVGFYLVGDTG